MPSVINDVHGYNFKEPQLQIIFLQTTKNSRRILDNILILMAICI